MSDDKMSWGQVPTRQNVMGPSAYPPKCLSTKCFLTQRRGTHFSLVGYSCVLKSLRVSKHAWNCLCNFFAAPVNYESKIHIKLKRKKSELVSLKMRGLSEQLDTFGD